MERKARETLLRNTAKKAREKRSDYASGPANDTGYEAGYYEGMDRLWGILVAWDIEDLIVAMLPEDVKGT